MLSQGGEYDARPPVYARAWELGRMNVRGRMRLLCAVMAVALLSGCITERRASFPSAVAAHDPLPAVDRTWALGQVFVSVVSTGANQSAQNWAPARRQIEERLAQTLREQPIGRRVEARSSAEVVVDVHVKLNEQRGINGWLAAAVVTGTAIIVGGAVAGFVIADRNGDVPSSSLGLIVGESVAMVPALGLAGLFPASTVTATAEATLTFRRASDGVAIMEKRTRAEWDQRHNGYFVEEKLDRITGEGAALLEKRVLVALNDGLSIAPRQRAPSDGSEGPSSDVPRRFVPLTEVFR